jgi:hypothetical protein
MPTIDTYIAFALLSKVLDNEPLSLHDAERWAQIITRPIQITSPKKEDVERLKFQMRQALQATYFEKQ